MEDTRRRFRVGMIAMLVVVAGLLQWRCGTRLSFLPLATTVFGRDPEVARHVVVMLHGHGGSTGTTDWLVDELRRRGVPEDVSLVFLDGPVSAGSGWTWGQTAEEHAVAVRRVEARITGWKKANPSAVVTVMGFSYGADTAAEVAAEHGQVTALVAFSGCKLTPRTALAARSDMRTLIVHGRNDVLCQFARSEELHAALSAAGRDVKLVEHQGNHSIPLETLDAVAAFLRAQPAR